MLLSRELFTLGSYFNSSLFHPTMFADVASKVKSAPVLYQRAIETLSNPESRERFDSYIMKKYPPGSIQKETFGIIAQKIANTDGLISLAEVLRDFFVTVLASIDQSGETKKLWVNGVPKGIAPAGSGFDLEKS